MIHPETIETIRQTLRIEEVIGDFVRLKRRGANLIGLCPFHDERTPSFSVSPSKGIFKCFGCGAAGDAVKFVMDVEHCSYPEALRYLAQKYRIPIEEKEISPEEKQEFDLRESLFAVNHFAAEHFKSMLWDDPRGQAIALTYLRDRGFTDESIRNFELGYAPDAWDLLKIKAADAGYKETYLQTLGLITSGERKVDMYRDRIMFPIHNLSGRVVGFGGRIIGKKENSPKYINSPESEIYVKRKILYGLFQAKKFIIKEDRCLLVEGYTDVISLHQHGIKHAVASSGTSLTIEQIRLIRRLTQNVTILYDGDPAGINASFRGIDMLLEEGMNVRVLLFPDGHDPDSFAKSRSPEELVAFLSENEQEFIHFKINHYTRTRGQDPVARAEWIRDVLHSIGLVKDQLVRNELVRQCAERTQSDEEALIYQLNQIRKEQFKKRREKTDPEAENLPEPEAVRKAPTQQPAPDELERILAGRIPEEDELARLIAEFGHHLITFSHNEKETQIEETITVAQFVVAELSADALEPQTPLCKAIWQEAVRVCKNGFPENWEQNLMQHENEDIRNLAYEIFQPRYILSENWNIKHGIITENPELKLRQRAERAVVAFKLKHAIHLSQSLRQELKTLHEKMHPPVGSPPPTEDEKLDFINRELQILEELQDLEKFKIFLSSSLSRVILP